MPTGTRETYKLIVVLEHIDRSKSPKVTRQISQTYIRFLAATTTTTTTTTTTKPYIRSLEHSKNNGSRSSSKTRLKKQDSEVKLVCYFRSSEKSYFFHE